MRHRRPVRPAARRARVVAASAAVVGAVLLGAVLARAAAPPSDAPRPAAEVASAALPDVPPPSSGAVGDAAPTAEVPRSHDSGGPPAPAAAAGEADGVVPDGGAGVDDPVPAVTRLDPALLAALRRAAAEAAGDRVELRLNSGWRSAAYQQQLLLAAVAEHGSLEEAARWVATPETSSHVTGEAVDVGPPGAAAWLAAHGSAHGLCPTYRNEPWHVELRSEAPARGCPAPYADAAHDPRLRP